MTCHIDIIGDDFSRIIACCDPIIDLRGRLCHPASCVIAKFHAADSRVIPKEAIASARKQEGNTYLGIPLDQFNDTAFLIQASMLMLAQSVNMFISISLETNIDVKMISPNILILP